MGVMQEDAAVTTQDQGLLYPSLVISGTSIFASMAASALAEPDRPPIKAERTMLTWPMPPRMWPTSRFARFKRRRVMPE